LRQLAKAFEHFRRIRLKLIYGDAGDGERYLNRRVAPNQFQQQSIGWEITILRYSLDDFPVKVIVEVASVRADIKEPERL